MLNRSVVAVTEKMLLLLIKKFMAIKIIYQFIIYSYFTKKIIIILKEKNEKNELLWNDSSISF